MKSNVVILAVAVAIACMQSAPAQTFKKISISKNVPVVQVAPGGSSVWALASNGNPYILKGKSFALANTIALTQIAVGGGNAAQADEVWGLNSAGSIYRASKSGTSWIFSQVPGLLDAIAVGPGYQDSCHPYEVWGLNPGSQIYRYNFCRSNFDQMPGFLCDIHVGGGGVWGAQCGPNTYRFNFSTGVFEPINSPFFGFPALTVGPTGEVWALDTATSGELYRYDPVYGGFQYIACCSSQIQAGGNGVWTLSGGHIDRWEPSTLRFVQVAGSLISISVGSGGGVWGINSSHQVFAFSTP